MAIYAGDELELVANTIETGDDMNHYIFLVFRWKLVSSSINLSLQNMDVGEYGLYWL